MLIQTLPRRRLWGGGIPPPQVPLAPVWLDFADTTSIDNTTDPNRIDSVTNKGAVGGLWIPPGPSRSPYTGTQSQNGLNVMTLTGGNNATGQWLTGSLPAGPDLIEEWFMVFHIDSVQLNGGCCLGIISNNGDRANVRISSSGDHTWRYNNDLVIPGAPGDGNDLGNNDGLWSIDDVVTLVPTDDVFQRYNMTRGQFVGQAYSTLRVGGDGVAGGRMISGALAELIGFAADQIPAVRADINQYLDEKWGL